MNTALATPRYELEARVRSLNFGDYRPELRIYVRDRDHAFDLLMSIVVPPDEDLRDLAQREQRAFEVEGWSEVVATATEAYKQDRLVITSVAPAIPDSATPKRVSNQFAKISAERWGQIEILVLSDHRIQIRSSGQPGATFNYAELGFGDSRRNQATPVGAWTVLLRLAETGRLEAGFGGQPRAKLEKEIQTLRKRLRSLFSVEGDPIPLEDRSYVAAFKIKRSGAADY